MIVELAAVEVEAEYVKVWLFGDNGWTEPVPETIYACMEMPV